LHCYTLSALPFGPMPHADSALVPEGTITRQQFWDHVYEQLIHLLGDERAWVCSCLVSTVSVADVLLPVPSALSLVTLF
jgi:hypothetical protein